jgi:hypothetical protein
MTTVLDLNALVAKHSNAHTVRFKRPLAENSFDPSIRFRSSMSVQRVTEIKNGKTQNVGIRLVSAGANGWDEYVINVVEHHDEDEPLIYFVTISHAENGVLKALIRMTSRGQ